MTAPLESMSSASLQAVLIMDLAESMRVMRVDPQDAVHRWRKLSEYVRNEILPPVGGRLVESRGDSLILAIPKPIDAVKSAFAIKQFCKQQNEMVPAERHFLLRTAIHFGELFIGENEVLGDAVNVAARLQSTVAGPDEIVISADVHDYLTPALDADVEDLGLKDLDKEDTRADDLGNVYLKHVEAPTRVYRVGPPGPRPVIDPETTVKLNLRPAIAVIPFTNRRRAYSGHDHDPRADAAGDEVILGEVLADDIITALSPATMFNVVSRLSTSAFGGRNASLEDIGAYLKANYVLSGRYYVHGRQVVLDLELAEVKTGQIKWSPAPLKIDTEAVVSRTGGIGELVASEIASVVMQHQLARGHTQSLPNLENYTLLINAIVRMHRGTPQHFERARQMLQTLVERMPRIALPHAWLAKWHVLRFNRGLSPDSKRESRVALNYTQRALDNDPNCALALTIDGFVHTNLLKRFDIAEMRYTQALSVNPNESLAWLLKGTMNAFMGRGNLAVDHTQRALKLSPLDPLRYFFDSLSATALDSNGQYEEGILHAMRSLKANRAHTSTLRILTILLVRLGRIEEARKVAAELMQLDKQLTVERYMESNPGALFPIGKDWAENLASAGVPRR